jgi:tripartite-type tricarboxylate transporter receptor subunit TctC
MQLWIRAWRSSQFLIPIRTLLSSVMRTLRIGCVAGAALVGLLTAVTVPAWAQAFPSRPVFIVVPFAPGGGTDILARILEPKLGTALGQPVIIENKPGASSMIGTGLVATSPADGYHLLMVDSTFAVNPSLQKKMPYDSLKDLVPVIDVAAAPVILVVNPSVPVHSVKELVALAKAQPDKLAFASGGIGASTHLAGELFKMVAGVHILHVPYKGTGPAVADVVAGHVQMTFTGISSARPLVEGGKLRALAVTGDKRNPAMPDVPTFTEQGFPGVDASTNWRVLAPAGTPPQIVARINAAFNSVLEMPDVKARIAELGYEVTGGTPEHSGETARAEMATWAKVVRQAGIKLD